MNTQTSLPPNALACNKLIQAFNIKHGAELGVRRGEFTSSLLQQNPKLNMIAVDIWSNHSSLDEQHPHESNYNTFCENIKSVKDRVIVHKMLTTEACKLVLDQSLDFIFFDATHTYESLKQDIMCWKNKLKPNGFFIGHDYHPYFDNGGMVRCIEEFMNIKTKLATTGEPYQWNENTDKIIDFLMNERGGVVDLTTTCWYSKKEYSLL